MGPTSRLHIAGLILLLSALATGARGQAVVRFDESLGRTRPEAWALNYVAASTFMTAFGAMPALAPGSWRAAVDFGNIPRLDEGQQRVGLRATKQEDLNKTPVFGRVRVAVGLPGAFVAELGYTPPVEIGGARPYDLFSLSLGRRLLEHEGFAFSARAFGQHGRVRGDVTCPARLAGVDDPGRNPFGCRAPSDDRTKLGYYGLDATASWASGPWRAWAGGGAVRAELSVQVDALTFGVRDRSKLTARGTIGFATLGGGRELGDGWSFGAEVLHVPLRVQRETGGPVRSDPLTSLRLQLAYRIE